MSGSLRILIVMSHDGFLRMFEPLLRELSARGHQVELALASRRPALMSEAGSIEQLAEGLPGLTWQLAPKGRDRPLAAFERGLTTTRDFLRYFDAPFAGAHDLRERAAEQAPRAVAHPATRRLLRVRPIRRGLDALLLRLHDLLDESPAVVRAIERAAPDVVLVTPLIMFGSTQGVWVRAARRGGIPSGLLVHSWDNLTNKGLIHDLPDAVVVWNDDQRREAVDLHRVPPERVVVTGAQGFDPWFTTRAATTRDAFCELIGLDPESPFVLYVCSSSFVAPDEKTFVLRWLRELRSEPRLAHVGVLVRPHPQNAAQWAGVDLGDPAARLWPDMGAATRGSGSRADYFDSIHHSAAVVGINTSALIEAAIQRRAVLAARDETVRIAQDGTLHFRHLTGDDGLLLTAPDLAGNVRDLTRVIAGEVDVDERSRRFLARFVRPFGVAEPATPRLADAVEALSARSRVPHSPTRARVPLQRALGALATCALRAEQWRRRQPTGTS